MSFSLVVREAIVPFVVECHLALSFPHVPFPSLPSSQPVEPSCPSHWKHLRKPDRIECGHAVPESILDMTPSKLAQTSPNCTGKSPGGKECVNRVTLVIDSLASWSHLPRIQLPRGRLWTVVHHLIISQTNSASEALRPHLLEHSPGG